MDKFIILLIIFSGSALFSQDLNIRNNPYDNAPENVKESNAFQSERYFYEQRMYPNNFIPKDAYKRAYEQKEELRNVNGYAMMGPYDTWTNLGPAPGFLSGWSNVSSRITTVQYDPNNSSIIYLGAANGGIWKSIDGGSTWSPKSDFENSLSSGSIAIDPVNSNIIYYGTGEATYSSVSYYGRGLMKSTNGGNNWVNITSGLPSFTFTSRIVIRPNNSSQLLAAMGPDGLYRSTNGGVSWSQLVAGRCDDVVFSPSGDSAYIVGSGTGYRISINGGANFSVNGNLPIGANRNHIAICKSNPNILYAVTFDGVSTIKVYKSLNHGLTFSQIVIGQDFNAGQAWYDFYIHVNPLDANNAFIGSIDIWRTTDGGATSFTNITNSYGGGNVHPDQQNFAFHPLNPNIMLCVNGGGINKSEDKGLTWTNLNTNLTLTQFYRIASDPSNIYHIIGGTQDNGTQRTTGSFNWTGAFGGNGGEVCFHTKSSNYILGETQNNGIMRSMDGGASWVSSVSGLSGSAAFVAPILSHPDTVAIFYTARQQVFKSANWGASWSPISTGTIGTIREMAISKSNAAIMYASSSTAVFRSTNRGYTFASASSGLPGNVITSLNIHPDSSAVAFATVSGFGTGHIYKTTNSGTSWINISGNLPDAPANDAFVYNRGGGAFAYYVATDIGVFVSANNGASWTELAGGLPNTVAMHLDYQQTSNRLRVGTHGRGVWEIIPEPAPPAAPCEDFTTAAFPPPSLYLEYTGSNYWSRQTPSAYGIGTASARFNFFNALAGTVQSLSSYSFAPVGANTYLTFDEAYAPFNESGYGPDTLLVEASDNSGSTYSVLATLIGRPNGSGELNSAPPVGAAYTPANYEWRPKIFLLPVGTNKFRLKAKSGFGNNLFLDNVCVRTLPTPINSFLGCTPQGFYRGTPNIYSGIPDTVRVYLHRVDYPNVIVDSATRVLDALTSSDAIYPRALSGTYYSVVKHRNSIETWSAAGGQLYTRGTNYYIEFLQYGAAYNNNQFKVNIANNFWGMFGGDIDRNNFIDATDVILVSNAAALFTTGYVQTDLTGNNAVDLSDLLLTHNNSANFVQRMTPPGSDFVPESSELINPKNMIFENEAMRKKYEAGYRESVKQRGKEVEKYVPDWNPMPSNKYPDNIRGEN